MKYGFDIGDWSEDGHGRNAVIEVSGDLCVEEVREAHYSCPEVLGFEIGDICSEFEESEISEDVLKILKEKGIYEGQQDFAEEPEQLCDLWLKILNHINSKLNLKRITVPEERMQHIVFNGFDEKKRHLQVPGYGIFYM